MREGTIHSHRTAPHRTAPLSPVPLYFSSPFLLRTAPHYLNTWNRLNCHLREGVQMGILFAENFGMA